MAHIAIHYQDTHLNTTYKDATISTIPQVFGIGLICTHHDLTLRLYISIPEVLDILDHAGLTLRPKA